MTRLIADIGGTNARFALVEGARPDRGRAPRCWCATIPTRRRAIEAYLGGGGSDRGGDRGGDAGRERRDRLHQQPVAVLDRGPARPRLGLRELAVINDFVAQALAMPHLGHGRGGAAWAAAAATPGRAVGVLGRRHRSRRLGAGARARWAGRRCRPRAATSRSRPATRARIGCSRSCGRGSGTSPTSGCCRARACSTSPSPWRRSTGAPPEAGTAEEVTEAARRGSCPRLRRGSGDVQHAARLGGRRPRADRGRAWRHLSSPAASACGSARCSTGPPSGAASSTRGACATYLEPIPTWLVLRGDTGLIGAAHLPARRLGLTEPAGGRVLALLARALRRSGRGRRPASRSRTAPAGRRQPDPARPLARRSRTSAGRRGRPAAAALAERWQGPIVTPLRRVRRRLKQDGGAALGGGGRPSWRTASRRGRAGDGAGRAAAAGAGGRHRWRRAPRDSGRGAGEPGWRWVSPGYSTPRQPGCCIARHCVTGAVPRPSVDNSSPISGGNSPTACHYVVKVGRMASGGFLAQCLFRSTSTACATSTLTSSTSSTRSCTGRCRINRPSCA